LGFVSSPSAISSIEYKEDSDSKIFDYRINYVLVLGPFLNYHTSSRNLVISRAIISRVISDLVTSESPDYLFIEEPRLQGIGNKIFLKFLGVLEHLLVSTTTKPVYMAPSQVKKMLGHGRLEKDELAEKVLALFTNRKDQNLIKKAIKEEAWDITDSLAIALAGLIGGFGD